jgi:hypothetical protein
MYVVTHYRNLATFSDSKFSDIINLQLLQVSPRNGLLLETLIVSKPVNKFTSLHEPRCFITFYITNLHWILT